MGVGSRSGRRAGVRSGRGSPYRKCIRIQPQAACGSRVNGRVSRETGPNGRSGVSFVCISLSASHIPLFPLKAIIKRWRQSSEEDFWHEFADSDGKQMTYTAITKKLADLHIIEDEKLAAKAKAEYGCKFDVFSYKKGGKTYTKTKASGIAHQCRRIAGLTDDEDDE